MGKHEEYTEGHSVQRAYNPDPLFSVGFPSAAHTSIPTNIPGRTADPERLSAVVSSDVGLRN
jgi:hypothetical protein